MFILLETTLPSLATRENSPNKIDAQGRVDAAAAPPRAPCWAGPFLLVCSECWPLGPSTAHWCRGLPLTCPVPHAGHTSPGPRPHFVLKARPHYVTSAESFPQALLSGNLTSDRDYLLWSYLPQGRPHLVKSRDLPKCQTVGDRLNKSWKIRLMEQ